MLFYSLLAALEPEEQTCAEQIFIKYRNLIYEIAYKILKNHHDAEDTLDEVMINVIKNITRFYNADRNDVEAQLVIYSRNAAINRYNKNKRRSENEMPLTFVNDEGEFEDIDIGYTQTCVEDIIISKESVEIVQKYIRMLPAEYIEVIKLVYGWGYSNAEAAGILNITPNAVGMRLFKARKKLLNMAGGELNECLGSKN